MKITSAIQTPYFFQVVPSSRRRPVKRQTALLTDRPGLIETNDELARKQEIVCGVILALSFVMTIFMCMAQLAHF